MGHVSHHTRSLIVTMPRARRKGGAEVEFEGVISHYTLRLRRATSSA